MQVIPEILNRKSIVDFKPDPIEKDKLERVLEAGRLAPSAKNRQEWRFIVITDKKKRDKIKDAAFGQEHVGQAPAIIVACTTNIDYRMPNGQLAYPIDLTFPVSFMMVQAVHEGLGTCCVTTYDEQEIKEFLSVPYSMRAVMLLLVGYAASEPEPSPRKNFKQVFSYNHW
ncbi:MAG: nitroreductase family protein [Spirochaetales bacterium]|nr:nitroreductase family protein [Spirochaetales bacterium]